MIIDMDTHVDPSIDVLQKYASPELARRWDELTPYLVPIAGPDGGQRLIMRVNPFQYARKPGESATGEERGAGAGGQSAFGAGGKTRAKARGHGVIAKSVFDADSQQRLSDMDKEGVDVHLIIPGTWNQAVTAIDPTLATELYAAYHRYIGDYASPAPARLKSLIITSGADPEASAAEIRRNADAAWAAAFALQLPEGLPIDDPSLDPIWRAAADAGLPLVFHPFTFEPPYFPGYRDVWGNVAVARTASFPWNSQRLVAFLVVAGLFDKWPELKVAFSETSCGWLPAWLKRVDMNRAYLPTAVADTAYDAVEYAQQGRIVCGIGLYEDPAAIQAVISQLGDKVLTYNSDYPHPECEWPDSVSHVRGWAADIGADNVRQILETNPQAFLRLI
jgi:uncharacterized protein